MTLVTRIAATSKSQIASDCNHSPKNHCDSQNMLLSQLFRLDIRQFCVVCMVFQKRHIDLEPPQNMLRLQACHSESQRVFFAQCDFCDCDAAILLRFLREKLATSRLCLPIASDLCL